MAQPTNAPPTPKPTTVTARPRGAAKTDREVYQETVTELARNIEKSPKVDNGTGRNTQLKNGTVLAVPYSKFERAKAKLEAAGINATEEQIAKVAVQDYYDEDRRARAIRNDIMRRTTAIQCKENGDDEDSYIAKLTERRQKEPHANKTTHRQTMLQDLS